MDNSKKGYADRMKPYNILLVDDDQSMRRIISFNLEKQGYKVAAAESGEEVLRLMQDREFELMISDIRMPGLSGIELMEKALMKNPSMAVIFITAYGSIESAVEAIKKGAYDYITKPFEMDKLNHLVKKALEYSALKIENEKLRSEIASHQLSKKIIGISGKMQEIMGTVERIAGTDATVLITGPSGVGKELIANAIHMKSERRHKRMVTINCASIPRDLLESELFGYTRGAFTGAVQNKTGKFVSADGGTIFLDEIGDLHMELQAKLLRVMQDHTVEPLGGNEPIPIDIRVIAATNQDLKEKVSENKFREDLFYRLNVIPIRIPPLKERPEDIPPLIFHFLDRFSAGPRISMDDDALELLKNYDWPGNVRELENLVKRVVILRKGDRITVSDLPDEIARPEKETKVSGGITATVSLADNEIGLITDALKRAGWNQSKAAKMLDIPRHVLIYRMKKYGIKEN
jgi:DNA-binding NtrC family response regulator